MSIYYDTAVAVSSALSPGVIYIIEKMSFVRRLDLMKSIRNLAIQLEFEMAAEKSDTMTVSVLTAQIDCLYLRWGLREVQGLFIDGNPATPELLTSAGPEELFAEALAAVKRECGLTDVQKKT
jgi:hypothetical protein